MPSFTRQALAVNRKNVRIKLSPKKLCNTLFEILMPLLYALFILTFGGVLKGESVDPVSYSPAVSASPLYVSTGQNILYTPDGPSEAAIVQQLLSSQAVQSPTTPTVQGFATYAEMRSYLFANNSAARAATPLALQFDLDLASNTSAYTMMLLALDNVYPSFSASESYLTRYSRDVSSNGEQVAQNNPWVYTGALAIELALDRIIANLTSPSAADVMRAMGGTVGDYRVARMPIGGYRSNYAPGSGWVLYVIPFYVVYGIMSIGFQVR